MVPLSSLLGFYKLHGLNWANGEAEATANALILLDHPLTIDKHDCLLGVISA